MGKWQDWVWKIQVYKQIGKAVNNQKTEQCGNNYTAPVFLEIMAV